MELERVNNPPSENNFGLDADLVAALSEPPAAAPPAPTKTPELDIVEPFDGDEPEPVRKQLNTIEAIDDDDEPKPRPRANKGDYEEEEEEAHKAKAAKELKAAEAQQKAQKAAWEATFYKEYQSKNLCTAYFYKSNNQLAFSEPLLCRRIAVHSPSREVIDAVIERAVDRGWKGIRVKGSPAFRQAAWFAAHQRGLKTIGYKPTKADKIELEHWLAAHPTPDRVVGTVKESKPAKPLFEAPQQRSVAAAAAQEAKTQAAGGRDQLKAKSDELARVRTMAAAEFGPPTPKPVRVPTAQLKRSLATLRGVKTALTEAGAPEAKSAREQALAALRDARGALKDARNAGDLKAAELATQMVHAAAASARVAKAIARESTQAPAQELPAQNSPEPEVVEDIPPLEISTPSSPSPAPGP